MRAPSNTATTTPLTAAQRAAIAAAAEGLVQHVVRTRMKSLYFSLSSDARHLTNSALALLGAIASLGAGAVRDLGSAFDWSLSALPNLAKPPKEKGADGEPIQKSKIWKQWRARSPLVRPTRALFVDFGGSSEDGVIWS